MRVLVALRTLPVVALEALAVALIGAFYTHTTWCILG